jgi:opacity protein-like surface antigen
MKKYLSLLGAVLTVGLLSVPALATEHYISGCLGIPAYQNLNSSYSYYASAANNLVRDTKISLNSGVAFFGAAGYDYGNFRIEGEIGYQTFNFDKITVHSEGTGNSNTNQVSVYVRDLSGGAFNETSAFELAGKGNVTSLMTNAYYDITSTGGIKPYVTVGAGVAQVRYVGFGVNGLPDPTNSNELNRQDSNTTTLAYQAGVGIAVPVTSTVILDARYRYFATARYDLAVYEDTSLHSNQFLVNLRVKI